MPVRRCFGLALTVAAFTALLAMHARGAAAVGTAITYQGQLLQNGTPVNGLCDLQFALFAVPTEGTPIGFTLIQLGVPVINGLITLPLDFGPVFDGGDRWLEIVTRCPSGSGEFVILQPRQPITATPYALGLALPAEQTVAAAAAAVQITNTGSGPAVRLVKPNDINASDPALVVLAGGFGAIALTAESTALSGGGIRGTTIGTFLPGVEGRAISDQGGTGVKGVANSGEDAKAIHGQSFQGFAGYFDGRVRVISGSSTEPDAFVVSVNGDKKARIDSDGKGFFNGGTQMGGADVAEFVFTSDRPGPGDVVEIDPDRPGLFRRAASPNSSAVAGVISTDPGVSLNAKDGADAAAVGPQLALVGRVPVKATTENGPIRPGDLLVASSTPGHAMRGPANPAPGTVIGKALTRLDDGSGVAEMLVMLR
jgi:hypothetical protein